MMDRIATLQVYLSATLWWAHVKYIHFLPLAVTLYLKITILNFFGSISLLLLVFFMYNTFP